MDAAAAGGGTRAALLFTIQAFPAFSNVQLELALHSEGGSALHSAICSLNPASTSGAFDATAAAGSAGVLLTPALFGLHSFVAPSKEQNELFLHSFPENAWQALNADVVVVKGAIVAAAAAAAAILTIGGVAPLFKRSGKTAGAPAFSAHVLVAPSKRHALC